MTPGGTSHPRRPAVRLKAKCFVFLVMQQPAKYKSNSNVLGKLKRGQQCWCASAASEEQIGWPRPFHTKKTPLTNLPKLPRCYQVAKV